MLLVPSKYRVARRLGAGIFDQTQTQKFALNEADKVKRRGRPPSDYGKQLLEKQRVRFTYGLSEKQLSRYAEAAFEEPNPSESLHQALETRLDMFAHKAGLTQTRRSARQAASHGHFLVNGTKVKVPSYRVKIGDVVTVRDGARKSPLYATLAEKNPEGRAIANWIETDLGLMTAKMKALPSYTPGETGLDYATVFEFYSR